MSPIDIVRALGVLYRKIGHISQRGFFFKNPIYLGFKCVALIVTRDTRSSQRTSWHSHLYNRTFHTGTIQLMFVATGIQTCTQIFLIRGECSTLRQQRKRRSHIYFCKIKFCGCCRIFPSFDLFPQLSKFTPCLFPLTSHLCNHCFSKLFSMLYHSSFICNFAFCPTVSMDTFRSLSSFSLCLHLHHWVLSLRVEFR